MENQQSLIITGVSSDLGRVLVDEFSRDPETRIIATMRRSKSASDCFPANVSLIENCDLTVATSCERLAAAADQAFAGPFGYIHSVGEFWEHIPFEGLAPLKAQELLLSHFQTLYNALHALIPLMRARRGGSCVAFSCNSVRYNYPWMAPFTAAKSAVDSLIRSLANEFSGDGLRFNSLVLASLNTPKVVVSKPNGDHEHFLPPQDIIPIIRFLLAKESYLVNGNTIGLFLHSDKFFESGYFQRIRR